jgi:ubiquitin C-terminal hydrolase
MTDHVGLANLGNTCFLNVVLQALRVSPPLVKLLLTDRDIVPREESNRKEILSGFQTLLRDFWAVNAPEGARPALVPRGFFHSLHTNLRMNDDYWYRPGEQCDAAEALQYILDSIHDATHRRARMEVAGTASTEEERAHERAIKSWAEFFSREYSPIVSNFNGQYQIKVTCTKCGHVSERYEPWLMIKAPIPGADVVGGPAPTLGACLDAAFESETIEDYACETCKERTTATKVEKISRLPPVAIVSIKRFTNAGHKVRGRIPWDLDALDYRPWMAFGRDPFSDSKEPATYSTYAVIEHHGSTHGGHYRMFTRHSDNTWWEYDDNSARPVSPDSVITSDSYIALMMPKHKMEAMNAEMDALIRAHRERRATPYAEEA